MIPPLVLRMEERRAALVFWSSVLRSLSPCLGRRPLAVALSAILGVPGMTGHSSDMVLPQPRGPEHKLAWCGGPMTHLPPALPAISQLPPSSQTPRTQGPHSLFLSLISGPPLLVWVSVFPQHQLKCQRAIYLPPDEQSTCKGNRLILTLS